MKKDFRYDATLLSRASFPAVLEACINLSKMHFGVGKLVQLCYNDSNSVHSIYGNTAQ